MKKTTFFAILLAMILGLIMYLQTQTKEEGLAVEPTDEGNQPANDEQSPDVATGIVEETISPEQQ